MLTAVAALCLSAAHAVAQEVPSSLFEYPQAPDSCATLESRSNYVLLHFWDTFDFGKPIVDDRALVKTFRDYADLFKYGHRNVVKSSIRDFMFKLRANTANLSKVGQVAELVLYSPLADYWSDEVYVEFAKSLAASTTLPKEERAYFSQQIGLISACQEGMPLRLEYTDAVTGGKREIQQLDSVMTVIVFVDDAIESRTGRTMLDVDLTLSSLVEQGGVKMLCLFNGTPPAGWVESIPDTWGKGYAQRINETIDLRLVPSCFLLDENHCIVQKNMSISDFKAALE